MARSLDLRDNALEAPMPPAGPFRFSTADVPAHLRRGLLRDLRERGLIPIEPLPNRVAQVDIVKWSVPELSILSAALCGVQQRATARESQNDLCFGINLTGD